MTIDGGVAVVNLSAEYTRLSGMDLTLADACIALTLSQLPEVERVSVLAQGQALPYRERQSMTAEDLLLSWMDNEARTLRARLYFTVQPRESWRRRRAHCSWPRDRPGLRRCCLRC